MNTQKTELLQGIPMLFDMAWDLYKQAFIKLLKVNWLPVLIGGLVTSIFTYISGAFAAKEILDPINLVRMIGVMFGMGIVSIVVSSLAYIAQVKVLQGQDALLDDSLENSAAHADAAGSSVMDIYKQSAPLFMAYFWVTFLTTLAIIGGFVLLLVPGIVFAIWFSFAPFIFILEGDRGVDALKKSKAYIRGIWTPVFYRYLALTAFMLLIGIAGGVLKGFLKSIFSLDLAGDLFLNFIYQLIVAPYFLVFIYEMYKDIMRANKEMSAGESVGDSAEAQRSVQIEDPGSHGA